MESHKITTLFIDGDDTLWPNAYAYYIPQLDAAKLICIDLMWQAPNPTEIINRATEIQVKNIKSEGRITKECFPLSYVQIYRELCNEVGKAENYAITSAIIAATEKYFLKDYTLFPFVKETLGRIKLTKILVTKGDVDIQTYKIENTRIMPYFDHIEIVNVKNDQTYIDILNKYSLKASECAMIGDSLHNDIEPALTAGMYTYHIHSKYKEWDKTNTDLNKEPCLDINNTCINQFQEILNYLE